MSSHFLGSSSSDLCPVSLSPSDNAHDGHPLNTTVCHSTNHSLSSIANSHHIASSGPQFGVRCVSVGFAHTLLLTSSGEVYGWGCNAHGQVIYNGPTTIILPIKLPITSITSISAGNDHSLAFSSQGQLYGWGSNEDNQIIKSFDTLLPITLINIPYNIKEVYGDVFSSALTQEGQVVKWGKGKSFELIKGLNNIEFISLYYDSFVAMDTHNNFFYRDTFSTCITKVPESSSITPGIPLKSCFLFDSFELFVFCNIGYVWKFDLGYSFNNKPTKVSGLSNIVYINGRDCIYAALNDIGKVFVWGELSRISNAYEDIKEPICIEALTNIEGISVGDDFLFAYNKNTVWAWGRNDKGQLGTGDLIDRPQPVKVFGSELLGSFRHLKKPLDSMFSGLIKLVYWEYLNCLQKLFGNHPYVKARFYSKCGISKRVAQFAQEVINGLSVQTDLTLKDPQDLNLNQNICGLQLRLSTDYTGPKVINTKIKKLDVCYNMFLEFDLKLLSFFPNVEVVKLVGSSGSYQKLILTHLSNLKSLELNYPFKIEQLPTSLVKLVLTNNDIEVTDLSYLTSLKELVVLSDDYISKRISNGQIPLPQSIVTLEMRFHDVLHIEIQLFNLKELIVHGKIPTNITNHNFPSLKFVSLSRVCEKSIESDFPMEHLKGSGLIKSVQLIENEYLVELSWFPWWVQCPNYGSFIDLVFK
ncbi:hypothetical protein P9112_004935 [Eukaryota sp. TZLM1-RC]